MSLSDNDNSAFVESFIEVNFYGLYANFIAV